LGLFGLVAVAFGGFGAGWASAIDSARPATATPSMIEIVRRRPARMTRPPVEDHRPRIATQNIVQV
jgi:ribose 1,5-bisphosphokinase PhnN